MGIDPTTAIGQWVSAHMEREQEMLDLHEALENLKGSADYVLMMMMYVIMPDAARVQEDKVKVSSAELNIASAVSNIVTNITNDLNGIKPNNPIADDVAQYPNGQPGSNLYLANDLVTQCQNLSTVLGTPSATWTNPDTGEQETKSWISGGTLTTVSQALTGFVNLIGTNGSQVEANVTTWLANPTENFGGSTGQQNIQSLNSNVQTANEGFGGLTQTASNAVQYDMSLVTQLQSCVKTLLTDIVTFESAMVKKLSS